MDTYEQIEADIATKYGKTTTTRKAIGDFMLAEDHAVNVKSNNVNKRNYSPNLLSIQRLQEWMYEKNNRLSFIFVDYEETGGGYKILRETGLIPFEHVSWDCLSIEAQGYGVIQKVGELKIVPTQTRADFYKGFMAEYNRFRNKEAAKHEKFSSRFIVDIDSIKDLPSKGSR